MFVKRNADGLVVALSREASAECTEFVMDESDEVKNFIQGSDEKEAAVEDLAQSDLDMVRVVEDLVNLLIDSSVIRFTDLPTAAQQKLLNRRAMRDQMNPVDLLDDGDDFNF